MEKKTGWLENRRLFHHRKTNSGTFRGDVINSCSFPIRWFPCHLNQSKSFTGNRSIVEHTMSLVGNSTSCTSLRGISFKRLRPILTKPSLKVFPTSKSIFSSLLTSLNFPQMAENFDCLSWIQIQRRKKRLEYTSQSVNVFLKNLSYFCAKDLAYFCLAHRHRDGLVAESKKKTKKPIQQIFQLEGLFKCCNTKRVCSFANPDLRGSCQHV